MVRVAVTGGIAAGKSTVLNILQACGAYTVSSDAIVHELFSPGTDSWQAIKQTFGSVVIGENGAIRRNRLADIIFASPASRRKLNQILHPRVLQGIRDRYVRQLKTQEAVFAVEIPLLIEVAWQDWFDRIIVVEVSPGIQKRRLKERGMSPAFVRSVLRSQLTTRAKIPFADWIVQTRPPLLMVEKQVRRIWALLSRSLSV